ncbi:unnamed protein product [Candida verbasci]|uniref:Transcription initiation factor IIA large subunit n=1 Tax=Candida verbasci TaxID=1227364 RepID=A0A9W4TYZ4_9ASCO|nr:unnamed protein product [Candida verbasci]
MSNIETSKLYESIIDDVINDSRQDFENSGIDEATLDELKKIWCEKLSNTGVANFSWDNEDNVKEEEVEEEEVKEEEEEEEVEVHARQIENQFTTEEINHLNQPITNTNTNNNNIQIKQEPNLGIELPPIIKAENNSDNNINNNHGLALPKLNQTDGSFELTIYTEDGNKLMQNIKNKNKNLNKKLQQVDGTLDDEEDDEDDDDGDMFNDSDDINSDLDDLESEKSEEEDGDQEGQIMLCLYDKVQRIKNKWKSSLKEGIANINQKDYVFHKATGECEW